MVDRVAVGPFTTSVTYVRPDGERVEWHSRAQRKHASRVSRARHGHEHPLWSPHRGSWWIAVLFSLGSICFLVAPFPGFVSLVGAETDGVVFFVGSMLFTVAAVIQWLEAINADRGPTGADGGRFRLLAWEPGRVDWWSSGIQLIGTFFFDFTTFRALTVAGGHIDVRPRSSGDRTRSAASASWCRATSRTSRSPATRVPRAPSRGRSSP